MRRLLLSGLLAAAMLSAGVAEEGEGRAYRVAVHPFDVQEAESQIDAMCSDGFLPVGMEVDEGRAISVIYAENADIPFTVWLLHHITDPGALEEQLSRLMLDGWLPMGFSRSGSGLYFLLVKADVEISSWRIATSSPLASDIEETLETYTDQGFVPYGVSLFEDLVWLLFLKTERDEPRDVSLAMYENEEQAITDGLYWATVQGKMPWGLMVQNERVSILYLH
jgi:hypothetical protein